MTSDAEVGPDHRPTPLPRDVVTNRRSVPLRKPSTVSSSAHIGAIQLVRSPAQLQTNPMFAPGSAIRTEQPLPTSILQAVAASGSTANTATANIRSERFFMNPPFVVVADVTTFRA